MQNQVLQLIPVEVRHFYADPPLLCSEDRQHYYLFLKGLIEDDPPRDLSEWIQRKEYVDNAWHAIRLGKLKFHRLQMEEKLAVADLLRRILPLDLDNHAKIQRLSSGWMSNTEATAEVRAILKQNGLSADGVTAMALTRVGEPLTLIEVMEERAVRRRNHALREIRDGREELILADPKRAKSKKMEVLGEEEVNSARSPCVGTSDRQIDLEVDGSAGAPQSLPVAFESPNAGPKVTAAALPARLDNAVPDNELGLPSELIEALFPSAPIGGRTDLESKIYAKLAGVRR
jgi:hypothetical protein